MMLLQNITGSRGFELLALTKARHEALHPLRVTQFQPAERKPQWGKVAAIAFWLAQAVPGEVALMVDADTVLHRAIAPIEFPASAHLGLVLARYEGWQWANSGVLFLRASGPLRRFVARVWEIGPQPYRAGCPEGGEQGALNQALMEKPDLRIAVMPSRFNSYAFAPAPAPIISAFHGLPHQAKVEAMRKLTA